MPSSVYLDATIPSFYFDERPGTIIEAWQELTVAFWQHAQGRYDLFVSDETLRELEDLGYPASKRQQCLALVANCKHLANANKFEHIQLLNNRRRLVSPMIVTPEQLLETNP